MELVIKKGNETINEYLKSRNIGPKKTTANIENKHPGYLHMLYRYAIYTPGNKVSCAALCIYINQRSYINTKLRENVSLMRRMLNKLFVSNGGTEISPLEKPLDTAAHKRSRLMWIRKYLCILTSAHVYIAYLDEMFFYTTSHMNFLIFLPKAVHEE